MVEPWRPSTYNADFNTSFGIRDTAPKRDQEDYVFLSKSGLQHTAIIRPSPFRTSVAAHGGGIIEPEFKVNWRIAPPDTRARIFEGGREAEEYKRYVGDKDLADQKHTIPRYKHLSRRYDEMHVREAQAEIEDYEAYRDHTNHFDYMLDRMKWQREAGRQYLRSRVSLGRQLKSKPYQHHNEAPGRTTTNNRKTNLQVLFANARQRRNDKVYALIAETVLSKPALMAKMFEDIPVPMSKIRGILQAISMKPDSEVSEREAKLILNMTQMRLHEDKDVPRSQAELTRKTAEMHDFIQRMTKAHDDIKRILGTIPTEYRAQVNTILFELVRKNKHVNMDTYTDEHRRLNFVAKELRDVIGPKSDKLTQKQKQDIMRMYEISSPTLLNILHGVTKKNFNGKDFVSEYIAQGRKFDIRTGKEAMRTAKPQHTTPANIIGRFDQHDTTRTRPSIGVRGKQELQSHVATGRHTYVKDVGFHLPGRYLLE